MLEPHARRRPEGPSPGRRRGVAVLAGVAWAAGAASVEAADASPTPAASPLAWLLLVGLLAVLLLMLGVACAHFYGRAAQQAERLAQSRREAQSLGAMLDVWQWRSDREHRLSWLRPPNGAGAQDWATAGAAPPALLWERFAADDAAALRARLDAAAALHDLPVRFGAGPDDTRDGLVRAAPVLDADGRFDGFMGTVREVTPAAPAAVAAAPVAAAPAAPETPERHDVAADGGDSESFGYTVSHDLRAPIRVVEGFTKILKEDYGRVIDRIGNDHLDRVLGAAARMNSMIDALLALSQLSARPLSQQPVNLSQLAGYVADDLRRQWPQREVALHIEPGMQVQGDPTLLRVVLENLLGNAWKYTAKCREAQIRFERDPQNPTQTFTVRDNGAGFDMRFADRLFGVFQRLHSANDFQGTGVGLASVRRIIRRHGGEIWAESEVERGATFYFTLGGR